jgi:excisionase family DNA binding protein
MAKHIELLTKQVAADRLGLSVRRVMELSMDDKFTRHKAYDPATKREAVMFDAAEVEQMRLANTPAAAPREQSRPLLLGPAAEPIAESDLDDGRGSGRLWLTLAEAAAYSGLPASILQALVEVGKLPALDVGVRPGGHWRVRRLDIDAIEGEKHEVR